MDEEEDEFAGKSNRWMNRTQRVLDKYTAFDAAGVDTRAGQFARTLKRRGVDVNDTSLVGDHDTGLMKMANQGIKGGEQAARLQAQITRNESEQSLLDMEEQMQREGRDSVAAGSEGLMERFAAAMGPNADMTSPAAQAAMAKFQTDRGNALSSSDRAIRLSNQMAINEMKGDINLGIVAQSLRQTGSLISALEAMDEQEDMISEMQRGTIMGSPTAALYRGLGGSSNGAIPFANSAWTSFQRVMTGMSQVMGAGAAMGGSTGAPAKGGQESAPAAGGGDGGSSSRNGMDYAALLGSLRGGNTTGSGLYHPTYG